MKQLITHFSDHKMIDTDKHNYIRYRIGRLKHELWLRNRKRNDITIDEYDKFIIDNLKTGKTCIFCLLYTSPSPRDLSTSRMPSSA